MPKTSLTALAARESFEKQIEHQVAFFTVLDYRNMVDEKPHAGKMLEELNRVKTMLMRGMDEVSFGYLKRHLGHVYTQTLDVILKAKEFLAPDVAQLSPNLNLGMSMQALPEDFEALCKESSSSKLVAV